MDPELVRDLWSFIENVNDDTPDRHERFFALRARVRQFFAAHDGSSCNACKGAGFLRVEIDGDPDDVEIQRCDECMKYKTDAEAIAASKKVGDILATVLLLITSFALMQIRA